MKIITPSRRHRLPVLRAHTCVKCSCVYEIEQEDLEDTRAVEPAISQGDIYVKCPACGQWQVGNNFNM